MDRNRNGTPGQNLSLLEIIAAQTRRRVEAQKAETPLRAIMSRISHSRAPHAFLSALRAQPVAIIAEIKRASPSEGNIAQDADPVATAGEYLKHGAAALSVLTEPEFFRGSLDFLAAIRSAFPEARLLMKDFLVDEYQVAQARLLGADAVLLLASLLKPAELSRLFVFARHLGLTALVEVHDRRELDLAAELGAPLIGVNNRDLGTLEVRLETSEELSSRLPPQAFAISESGIGSAQQIKKLQGLGYRGFLVGTALMKTGRPGEALEKLLEECRQENAEVRR